MCRLQFGAQPLVFRFVEGDVRVIERGLLRPGQLRISAARVGPTLKLTVEDNGVGLPSDEINHAGVGLANVRERLATLHGNAPAFNIAGHPQSGVVVNIELPARTETTPTVKEDAVA